MIVFKTSNTLIPGSFTNSQFCDDESIINVTFNIGHLQIADIFNQ